MANIIDGLHLIVDGTSSDVSLYNEENLRAMFYELVDAMEMTIIVEPFFKQVELEPEKLTGDKFCDEGGISGLCMVNTSHVAVHCWPLRNAFMFDASSCKRFDAEKALAVIHKRLAPSTISVNSLIRHPGS